jgi:hypothetical protein
MATRSTLNNIQFMTPTQYKAVTPTDGTIYFVEDDELLTAPIENVNIIPTNTSTNAITIDGSVANVQSIEVLSDIAITLNANCEEKYARTITLILRYAGSHSLTWANTILWAGGTKPEFTGGYDIITLLTIDAGATWFGGVNGLNFK